MNKLNLTQRITLAMFIVFSPVSSFAHGTYFHSLCELAQHIDDHISSLESLLQQTPLNAKQMQSECRELVEHAKQYQRFARTLIRQGDSIQEARILEVASASLVGVARQNNLAASVDIMKEMHSLICAEMRASSGK